MRELKRRLTALEIAHLSHGPSGPCFWCQCESADKTPDTSQATCQHRTFAPLVHEQALEELQ